MKPSERIWEIYGEEYDRVDNPRGLDTLQCLNLKWYSLLKYLDDQHEERGGE
jgi:hypothetical protein